jgi:acetyl esterase/lipase
MKSSRPTPLIPSLALAWLTSLAWLHAQEDSVSNREPDAVLAVWPSTPPGDEQVQLEGEKDVHKETDKPVAGRKIIKLTNVTKPTLALYRPDPAIDTGAAMVICPGGGHNILAYDLEGTEVAQWLNTLGINGMVLKYRVPFRDKDEKWRAPVQDTQRALSLVRSQAASLKIRPDRIGVLGFSAGGETAGRAAFMPERQYPPIDAVDQAPFRPDLSILIYPAYLFDASTGQLRSNITIDSKTAPVFLVHTIDDPVTAETSLAVAQAMKKAKVPAELHLYDRGGHGYGLRKTDQPVTRWPAACESWLRVHGWLSK